MTLSVDMFFSFRSPYSYIALTKTRQMLSEYDISVRLRPVYPLAVRIPDFFKKANPQFVRYVTLDSARIAESQCIPFRWPIPDPIVQDMATSEVSDHQPYIFRLTRLSGAAQLVGRSFDFAEAIASLLWSGNTDQWHTGDHLLHAAASAGFDLEDLEREIRADTDRIDRVIQENESDLAKSGHWGVPTFVFEDEAFFGQDRVEVLIWRMKKKGLKRRAKVDPYESTFGAGRAHCS